MTTPSALAIEPMPDFATRLRALGLKQVQFARWARRQTDHPVSVQTLSKWARGVHPMDPWADLALGLAERHPAVLAEIKEMGR